MCHCRAQRSTVQAPLHMRTRGLTPPGNALSACWPTVAHLATMDLAEVLPFSEINPYEAQTMSFAVASVSPRRATTTEVPWTCLGLCAFAVGVHMISGSTQALQYDRAALLFGELWRVISCHWAHFTSDLLVWDLLAFACLGIACERRCRTGFLLAVLISSLLIPVATWLFMPWLTVYCGLSGIASAMFGLLGAMMFIEGRAAHDSRQVGVVVALTALFAAKTVYEAVSGDAIFVSDMGTQVVPVPLAHVVGLVAGASVGWAVDRRTAVS